MAGLSLSLIDRLQLFKELARRAGDIHSTRNAALAVLHALHDARRLGALRAIRALLRVHNLFAVSSLGNLGHLRSLSNPDLPLPEAHAKLKQQARRHRALKHSLGTREGRARNGSTVVYTAKRSAISPDSYPTGRKLSLGGPGVTVGRGAVAGVSFGTTTFPIPDTPLSSPASPGRRSVGAAAVPLPSPGFACWSPFTIVRASSVGPRSAPSSFLSWISSGFPIAAISSRTTLSC